MDEEKLERRERDFWESEREILGRVWRCRASQTSFQFKKH